MRKLAIDHKEGSSREGSPFSAAKSRSHPNLTMILKAVILLWLASFALSLLAKAQGRVWMMRLFVGGFCLLLLGIFMKIISRIL